MDKNVFPLYYDEYFLLFIGLSLVDKRFFLSYDKINFFIVDKFFELEEVYPSLFTVSTLLDSLQFKLRTLDRNRKEFWGVINYFGKRDVFSENIKLSKDVKLVQNDIFLFKILSSSFYFKVILKLGF